MAHVSGFIKPGFCMRSFAFPLLESETRQEIQTEQLPAFTRSLSSLHFVSTPGPAYHARHSSSEAWLQSPFLLVCPPLPKGPVGLL